MSEFFQVSRWRPGPLLPPRDARDGALVFVVAVLCFLACLTAFAALAAGKETVAIDALCAWGQKSASGGDMPGLLARYIAKDPFATLQG